MPTPDRVISSVDRSPRADAPSGVSHLHLSAGGPPQRFRTRPRPLYRWAGSRRGLAAPSTSPAYHSRARAASMKKIVKPRAEALASDVPRAGVVIVVAPMVRKARSLRRDLARPGHRNG